MEQNSGRPSNDTSWQNAVEQEEHDNIARMLAQNDLLVKKGRKFQTQRQPFNIFYQRWDKTQSDLDEKPMNRFMEVIIQRYNQTKTPLSIADIGCGYGKQAFYMKRKLEEKGVAIQRYCCYDISADLIGIAKEKYGSEPKMEFLIKNFDTQLNQVAQFDVIVSFIALQWANDILATTEAISRSLRPKGLFFCIIAIDCEHFHELRVKFINTSKWAQCFSQNQRKVSHFFFNKQAYLEAFQQFFATLFESDKNGCIKMTHSQCVEFFGNFITEVRHLIRDIKEEPRQEAIIRAYTSDLMTSIPLGWNKNPIRHEDNTYSLKVTTFEYQGIKK